MRFKPHKYQQRALEWIIQRTVIDGEPGGAFFMDPGLGKTSITLAWLKLLQIIEPGTKTLVVAPLRVVYSVWSQECAKWDQFNEFRCQIVHGSPTKRMAALSTDADLYLINPAGLVWLKDHYAKRPLPFDTLVVDESSQFKSWGSKRTKAIRKLLPRVSRRLILTGTPSPNSVEDLFAQAFIVDDGKALGTGITKFHNRYFYRGGFGGYKWSPNEGSADAIARAIEGFCLRLSSADHLDLPELVFNDVWIDLPPTLHKQYKKLERDMYIALDDGQELIASNAGAKYVKCKQYANGGVYDVERNPVHLHTAKIDALVELAGELQGKPLLIAFQFKHDLERIRKVFPGCPSIDGGSSGKAADDLVQQWNRGELRYLAVQPQAISHGINMQAGPGRDIAWLGLTDSLETYLQLNARIHRQGVTGQVRVHRILAKGTVDEAVRERIETKDGSQAAILKSLNDYRKTI